MANSLQDQLQMFDYWANKKGLEETLEHYAPDVANDPAVEATLVQMQNARRALFARVRELQEQFLETD